MHSSATSTMAVYHLKKKKKTNVKHMLQRKYNIKAFDGHM